MPALPSCLLLADRHQGLLEGIQGLLGSMFEAVVTVSDEPSLREGARRLHATLAVLDLGLAPDGLGVLRRLRNECPEQRIIVLSPHDSQGAAEAAFRSGAHGYVLKHAIADDLLPAVETVLAGRCYCSPQVALHVHAINDRLPGDPRPGDATDTKRRRDE
jgi:DNA-binding NarL/FixJ family response regulator